jgi:uncharacterized iron-regulated membrane protein
VRKLLFWLHLVVGITAGIIIGIMCVTGVLLTYEKQVLAWADGGYFEQAGKAEPGQPRVPITALLANIQTAAGAAPTNLTYYAESPVISAAAGGTTWYADSSSGDVLGASSATLRSFFRKVTDWHRYVALSGDSRPLGKSITGAANLLFLFVVVSGAVLWLPRTLSSVRSAVWFRPKLRGKARNWNWHNTFGVWAAIPLFLVVLSATVISYPWASSLVYTITGTEAPAPQGNAGGSRAAAREQSAASTIRVQDIRGIDALMHHANTTMPDWKTIALRMPATESAPLVFTVDRGRPGQPQHRATLTIDRETGNVANVERFEDMNSGRRWRSWLRYVHTGEYYGTIGQAAAGLASFAGVMLAWTGFALAIHRFLAWVRRLRPVREPIPATQAYDREPPRIA